jgi:hypothetical protein
MIFDKDRMMKKSVFAVLVFVFLFSIPVLSSDNLYDGFKNPPTSARPVIKWKWDANGPGEQEITRKLDVFKKSGFGGVEIVIGEDVNSQLLKFAADAAKQRGMIVDLSLGGIPGSSDISPAERGLGISISKKQFTGPATAVVDVNDLINAADQNQKLMFLRLVQTNRPYFVPGEDLTGKIKPDGSVAIDINDSNSYTLYAGVMHLRTTAAGAAAMDLFNKQAVEKYLKTIPARSGFEPGEKLSDYIHAVVCSPADLSVANWATNFQKKFFERYNYNLSPYLPLILDSNLPVERTRFFDTIRRVRYDFYTFLADAYRESFVLTFQKFCRDNGILSCIPTGPVDTIDSCSVSIDIIRGYVSPTSCAVGCHNAWDKIASSSAHLADKSLVVGELVAGTSENLESLKRKDAIGFTAGINRSILADVPFLDERNPVWSYAGNWTERNARLSCLFQNARRQARIAIIFPRGDLWSDCGPSESRLVDYFWYLFPLWDALNQNGYTVDFVSEKIFPETTFEDGKLHFGSNTYDAVVVPDMFSMEFLTAKALRFFAVNGGKIVFIGREPLTSAGFKDFFQRSVAVDLTMRHIKDMDPNRVLFIPVPEKDKDKLLSLTSDMMKKISVLPTVRISPPGDKLLFVHYLAEDRDVFFFANTDNAATISFRADFNTAGKTPWLWNPDTGKRDKFTHIDKSGALNISIKAGDSLLLVFEPKPAKPKN